MHIAKMQKRFILLCWSWICLQLLYVILLFSCFGHNNEIEWLFVIKYQLIGILLYRKNPLICKKLNCINMKKIFILLFVSLALFSCEKEENNKIFKYQLLPSENVSKPFSCLGRNVLLLLQLFKKYW